MKEKEAFLFVLLIVLGVGFLGLFALFTSAIDAQESTAVTGATVVTAAAVKGQIATLCKDGDGVNPKKKGIVQVYYGSQFPDQCYGDRTASKDPENNGQYLREYVCEENQVSYKIYNCGTSDCQYGACVTSNYYKMS